MAVGSATPALAQDPGVAAERFQAAIGPGNLVTVETARVPADFSYSLGLVLDYARQPLRLRHCLPGSCSAPGATIDHLDVVRDLATASILAALTPVSRLQIGLRIPVQYIAGEGVVTDPSSAGYGGPQPGGIRGFAMGDPTLEAKVRAIGAVGDPITVGAALSASAPLGHATAPGLYALDKLRVAASLDLAVPDPIKVAVVDTGVDETHPDLVGVVEARFDAIGGGQPVRSLDHGTAMTGAIAARGQVRGVAPSARILSARAFDTDGAGGALGSSETIIKAIDWSVRSGARVVNMSFAGPKDPALHEMLAAAAKRGVVLVAAMGNAGPQSPPLYPGADENVIAITATDADDHVFPMANVGAWVAAAAPGVDVLLPAPNAGYSLETGTSVSAALASGVVALVFERKPRATVQEIRKWLTSGARHPTLGLEKTVIGAGVIDAAATMQAAGGAGVAGR